MLSLCTLCGNYLVQSVINIPKRHPLQKTRPLIYWDIVLLLLPAEMGGAQLGVVLSAVLPEAVIIIITIVILAIVLPMYSLKGYQIYNEETEYLAGKKNDHSSQSDSLIGERADPEGGNSSNGLVDVTVKEMPPMIIPYVAIYVISVFAALYIILDVIENYYSKCSASYDAAIVIVFPVIAAFTIWATDYLTKQQEASPHLILKGDIDWSASSYVPVLLSFTVGAVSSMCGIGGGELMSPMLLSLGVRADLATATISLMSLLNTSSSTIKYMLLDEVPYGYATLVFFIGAAAGLSGRFLALYAQEEFGRISIMIFAVCAVLFASLIINIYDISTSTLDFNVDSFC